MLFFNKYVVFNKKNNKYVVIQKKKKIYFLLVYYMSARTTRLRKVKKNNVCFRCKKIVWCYHMHHTLSLVLLVLLYFMQ